jgi:hypothetical protein
VQVTDDAFRVRPSGEPAEVSAARRVQGRHARRAAARGEV